jgi:hypothetical protein
MADNVLTYPEGYYVDKYSRQLKISEEYKLNMIKYLRSVRPDIPESALNRFVGDIIRQRYKPSNLKYLKADEPCNLLPKVGDLLAVTNELNDNILSPYGAAYCPISESKSVFSEYIEDNQKERKRVKHEMFLAELRGDDDTVRMNDLKQKNIKININVLSGVMLSNVTFRSSINYNAITGTARFGIMTAYAVTELALASNYYFYSEDKAINWIISLLRIYPGDNLLSRCIDKYSISIPTKEKVFEEYAQQVLIYTNFSSTDNLRELIFKLTPYELAFIYYAVNLKRIFHENDSFRVLFDEIINIEIVPNVEGDVPKVAKLQDGLIQTFTIVILSAIIGKTSLEDIDAKYPDIARRIYSVYLHIEKCFKKLELLFDTFIMLPIVPSDIGMHKNMIRNTILLSDTDSILFTNISWIKWFTHDIKVTETASRCNAAVVTLISKLLEHTFAYMSASMNIDISNMRTLSIKNEFMYDIFLRTPISKHYAGYIKFREGVRQDPYKFDLKGKNFKGSDLCKETTSFVKWFIKDIFDSFLQTYILNPEEFIKKVIVFEQRIKKSIANGEVTFLTQKPINMRNQYKLPESSNYLYYELWQAVFAEKYGDLNLPQKTKELPILTVSIKDIKHLDDMKAMNPKMRDDFIKFITKYPTKKFSRILIPMDIPVPEELRPMADYRKVCAANCYSLELILRSFNIVNYPNGKEITLFSDIYHNLLQEITDEQQERIHREAAELRDDETEEDEDDYEENYEDDEFDESDGYSDFE